MAKIIDRVAVKYLGVVYSLPEPYRHHHVLGALNRNPGDTGWDPLVTGGQEIQGFLKVTGEFVGRLAGLELVMTARQFLLFPMHPQLYSENLWSTPGNWQALPGTPEHDLYHFHESTDRIDSLLRIDHT